MQRNDELHGMIHSFVTMLHQCKHPHQRVHFFFIARYITGFSLYFYILKTWYVALAQKHVSFVISKNRLDLEWLWRFEILVDGINK